MTSQVSCRCSILEICLTHSAISGWNTLNTISRANITYSIYFVIARNAGITHSCNIIHHSACGAFYAISWWNARHAIVRTRLASVINIFKVSNLTAVTSLRQLFHISLFTSNTISTILTCFTVRRTSYTSFISISVKAIWAHATNSRTESIFISYGTSLTLIIARTNSAT